MLDKIPDDIVDHVWKYISQQDRVKLNTLNKSAYEKYSRKLYQNLFLNRLPVFESDPDLNDYKVYTKWTYLCVQLPNRGRFTQEIPVDPLSMLVRSLEQNTDLIANIENIYCTWHIDKELKYKMIDLLAELLASESKTGQKSVASGKPRAQKLISFENSLDYKVFEKLHMNYVFNENKWAALDVPPIVELPSHTTDLKQKKQYMDCVTNVIYQSPFEHIQSLTLHFNPVTFLKRGPQTPQLQLKELCLNFRNDKLEVLEANTSVPALKFHELFNPDRLEKIELVSWYDQIPPKFYQKNHILDMIHSFPKLRSFKLASLPYDEEFLKLLFSNFVQLNYLHLDFYIESNNFNHNFFKMHVPVFQKNLEYLYLRINDELIPDTYSMSSSNSAGASYMEPTPSKCPCKSCMYTFSTIIGKYYYQDLKQKIPLNGKNISQRFFMNQIFQRFNVLPYCANILNDEYPSVGYGTHSLSQCSQKIHELWSPAMQKATEKLTWFQIRALYFYTYHQYAQSFDFFQELFPLIRVLVINDIPSRILNQKNYPMFWTHEANYKSNQQIKKDELLENEYYDVISSYRDPVLKKDEEQEHVEKDNESDEDSDFDW